MVSYIINDNGIITTKNFDVVDDEPVGLMVENYLNTEEIVYDIITNRLSNDDALYFKDCTTNDLLAEYLGFGMWIRNTYALWDRKNPMTETEKDPVPNSKKHPDSCSMRIMELVNLSLNGKYVPVVSDPEDNFTNAMKIVGVHNAVH